MTSRASRRRWTCRCGQQGEAATPQLALAELLAHDQLAHVEPERRIAAAAAMFRTAAP